MRRVFSLINAWPYPATCTPWLMCTSRHVRAPEHLHLQQEGRNWLCTIVAQVQNSSAEPPGACVCWECTTVRGHERPSPRALTPVCMVQEGHGQGGLRGAPFWLSLGSIHPHRQSVVGRITHTYNSLHQPTQMGAIQHVEPTAKTATYQGTTRTVCHKCNWGNVTNAMPHNSTHPHHTKDIRSGSSTWHTS